MKNFPGPFSSPQMFKYNKKSKYLSERCKRKNSELLYTVFKYKQQSTQTGWYTIAACFPFEPTIKMIDFQGYFSRTFQVLEEAWEPWYVVAQVHSGTMVQTHC